MINEQDDIRYIRERIQMMYDDPASRVLFWTVAEAIPLDMLGSKKWIPEPLLEDDDWAVWKPVPSTITDVQMDELQQEFQLQLPPRYRAYLKAYHLLDWQLLNRQTEHGYPGSCSSFMFPSLDTAQGLSEVKRLIQQWEIFKDTGYIPFAIGEDGQGIVCFDTFRQDTDGDCPIVWMMLDTLAELPDGLAPEDQRAVLEPRMEHIFGSFGEMIDTVFRKRG